MIKFLSITDLHYCDRDVEGAERRNCLSAKKLKNILKEHLDGCNFIMNFGDTADQLEGCGSQEEFMKEIAGILDNTGVPYYCAIGNHDTSLHKNKITKILNMPHRYYSFEENDFTFIVLDGSIDDINNPYPESEIKWAYTHLDPEQLAWLEDTINKSNKPVIVFCHELFIRDNYENLDDHVMQNRDEAFKIFEKTDKVKAVFCGHCHFGDYTFYKGIHFVTFNALCLHDKETCAEVTIDKNQIIVDGYGFQNSYKLDIK